MEDNSGRSSIRNDSNREFISKLYSDHSTQMFNYALSILKCRSDAEDCIHDVFVKLIYGYNTVKTIEEYKLERYLSTLVKHTAIDILRKKKHIAAASLDELHSFMKDYDPDAALIKEEDHKNLLYSIHCLNSNEQLILELKYLDELSSKQIASDLGISVTTVNVRLYRIRSKLKKEYESREKNEKKRI